MPVYKRLLFCLLLSFFSTSFQWAQDQGKDDKLITVAFGQSDLRFNPLHTYTATEAQIYTALYEGLVSYHPLTMEPLPAAASRWEISPDKTVYHFYLRENGRFWNGDPVTAFDFRNSWLKLIDPKEKGEYASLLDIIKNARAYRTGKITDPDKVGIRVVSPYILEVELEHPASHFLKILCHHSFAPVHPKYLNRDNWAETKIIPGNGPFYVYSISRNKIRLLKNQLYWDADNITVPGIDIILSDDPHEITQLFNSGKIQWAADGIQLDEVQDPQSIVSNPLFATNYFFFSCRTKPWNNPQVRRALALLLPWKEIRSQRFMYLPAETLVPRLPYYPEVKGIPSSDETEALKLLEEAGYPKGDGLPDILIKIPQSFEARRIAAIMQSTWNKLLDIKVEVQISEFGKYYDQLKDGNYTLGTVSWIGDFPDPLTFLQMWTKDSNLNDAGYNNPEYEKLIDSSMSQTGRDRYKELAQAEELLLSSAVVLPVNNLPAWNLVNRSTLEGWYTNPMDLHPFKYIQFKKLHIGPGIAMN